MRCYYEVLEVKQDASDEELRKSYRRLALQLHPDKNPDNAEEAKSKFQEIQGAYEVLSDPQERAFYDRNRENILHGEEFGSGKKEESLDLYKYFTASCYSGFSDAESGFYTVYRRVFDSISAKDLRYMDDEEEVLIPTFGKSDTDLEDVAVFYGYWQSYCTSMSFYWVDKYDVRQAQNRWVEKRIERENKKVRDKAKKEYNEKIRSLVSFVRKRDKRWEARKKQIDEKVAANARKQSEVQRQQRETRRKWMEETLEEQKESLSQYEQQLKEMESQFAEEWGKSESSDTDSEDNKEEGDPMAEGLYCIACEKLFKSDKAFTNHEKSRKHQEKQAALAALMRDEEAAFRARGEGEGAEAEQKQEPGDDRDAESESSGEEIIVSSSKKKKKKKKRQKKDVEPLSETKSKKKLSRRNKQSLEERIFENSSEEETEKETIPRVSETLQNGVAEDSMESSDSDSKVGTSCARHNDTKKKKVKGKSREQPGVEDIQENLKSKKKLSKKSRRLMEDMVNLKLEDSSSETETEVKAAHLFPKVNYNHSTTKDEARLFESADESNDVQMDTRAPKLKGKKAKEAKKKLRLQQDQPSQVDNSCTVCRCKFDSKNKLFNHLKSTGHAAIKTTKSKRE